MPRRTPEQLQARREEIARAAVRCFARNGFHATSMDDVIAEAGLSAGAVYRYYRGKDDLVLVGAERALAGARGAFDELMADGAAPAPEVLVRAGVEAVLAVATSEDADLTRIAVQVWGEALRNPVLHDRLSALYAQLRGRFVELARRRQALGLLPAEADPEVVGQVLFALVPGFLLQRLLVGVAAPDAYAAALGHLTRTPAD